MKAIIALILFPFAAFAQNVVTGGFPNRGTVTYDSTVPRGYPVGFAKYVELDSHAWLLGLVIDVKVTPVNGPGIQKYHIVNIIAY